MFTLRGIFIDYICLFRPKRVGEAIIAIGRGFKGRGLVITPNREVGVVRRDRLGWREVAMLKMDSELTMDIRDGDEATDLWEAECKLPGKCRLWSRWGEMRQTAVQDDAAGE